MIRGRFLIGLGAFVVLLSGCNQVRVDRWTDIERPCQPHGFYIAPMGETLASVAQTCKTDERILKKHNAWLTTRQPFVEPTVVWLKQNPNIKAGDEDLAIEEIETAKGSRFKTETLAPISLPSRPVITK